MIGLHVRRSDATEATRYFVQDHLGSNAVLVDEQGAVAERLAYDAWGKRRYPNGADDTVHTLTSQTTRGFTGHEMIDEMDLVNMNGRVYDPTLGRFLSADPFIHDVTNSQDLNRYSYVHNPLSYTDMNGYGFFKSIGKFFKKFWKVLLAIVVALTLQFEFAPALFGAESFGALAAAQPLTAAAVVGVSSGVSNVIVTGKPKAFFAGFGQGVATFGLGHGVFGAAASKFGTPQYFGKAVARRAWSLGGRFR